MSSGQSRRLLITAGPTREMLDPVRFISNVSTGEMGYSLAQVARQRGYEVTLISGPTALRRPPGIRYVPITSAAELKRACEQHFPQHEVLVMVAAVCDFTAIRKSRQKIHRTSTRHLELKQTPDIVASLARRKKGRKVIGFCLETENWLDNARRKLERKHLDGIVANYYSGKHIPFGRRRINTAFLSRQGVEKLRNMSKRQIAGRLLRWIESMEKSRFVKNKSEYNGPNGRHNFA